MENNLEEVWKPVKTTNGKYEVSNMGNVRSVYSDNWYNYSKKNIRVDRIKQLKPQAREGYLRVRMYFEKKWITKNVHFLVMEAFGENPSNLPEINHINAIKSDNRFCNLEWITGEDNRLHAKAMGLIISRESKDVHNSKKAFQYTLDGKLVRVWDSCMQTSLSGFCESTVRACCSGRKKTHANHVWSFVELSESYFRGKIVACHSTKRRPIAAFDSSGNLVTEYSCAQQVKLDLLNPSMVGKCAKNGKIYKKLYWKYI